MTNTVPALDITIGISPILRSSTDSSAQPERILRNPGYLTELSVQQRLGLPALCEMSFDSQADLADQIRIGQGLEVAVQNSPEPIFRGEITAIEFLYPPASKPTLRVRAYDVMHRLRKRQHVKSYSHYSLGGLVKELSSEAQIIDIIAPAINLPPLLIQHQQNDLEFLTEQAGLVGLYPLVRLNTLYLIPLSGLSKQADYALEYGENLLEARVEANTDNSCDQVTVIGWRTATAEALRAQERSLQANQQVNIQVGVTKVGGQPDRILVNQTVPNEEYARLVAQAELARRKAGDVVLWGRAEGSHMLQPGMPVQLTNVASIVRGRYILTQVTHNFDFTSGYTVEFSTQPPEPLPRSRCDVITLGAVLDYKDPEKLGRVRVSLPAYNGVQTSWLPVVYPGAGRGHGFFTPPEINDRVLVVLAREDPANGMVLGGLYPPNPSLVAWEEGNPGHYTWQTVNGQRIRLDIDKKEILMETGRGAQIRMEDNEIIIRAGRIDFQRS